MEVARPPHGQVPPLVNGEKREREAVVLPPVRVPFWRRGAVVAGRVLRPVVVLGVVQARPRKPVAVQQEVLGGALRYDACSMRAARPPVPFENSPEHAVLGRVLSASPAAHEVDVPPFRYSKLGKMWLLIQKLHLFFLS